MTTQGKTAIDLLNDFFYSDSRRGLNLWEWLFVLFVKLLVVLSICLVVVLLMAVPALAIWGFKPIIIFLFDHWPWTVGALCLLIAWAIVANRIRSRKTRN
jgi:hypothetical protein